MSVIPTKRRFWASKIMKCVTKMTPNIHSMKKTMIVAKLRKPTAARAGRIVAFYQHRIQEYIQHYTAFEYNDQF